MNKLVKILESANVESFYIHKTESHDLFFRFEFTILTNKGSFRSTVDFDDHLLEDLTLLFRPAFGDKLKEVLINLIKDAIQNQYEEEITINYVLY